MATTLIDAVIDGLVTTLRASASLDAPGGTYTPVFDGPTPVDGSARDFVTVGWADGGRGAQSRGAHHDIGYTTSAMRDDVGSISVVISCWDGDTDIATTRARVFTILGYVETAIRNNPTLGVANLMWSHVVAVELMQDIESGALAELTVTVEYAGVI